MKLTKNRFLAWFSITVVILAVIRFSVLSYTSETKEVVVEKSLTPASSIFFDENGKRTKHKIFSVPSFRRTFPDDNDVQLVSAKKHGVKPVENRDEAEHRKKDLVFVGSNPYYHVEKLKSSIPFLVPDAAILLTGHRC